METIKLFDSSKTLPWPSETHKLLTGGPNWREDAMPYDATSWDAYARGFYSMARIGCEHAIMNKVDAPMDSLIYPILFNYRQYLECQLKSMIGDAEIVLERELLSRSGHRLLEKWMFIKEAIRMVWPECDMEPLISVEQTIKTFDEVDPTSQEFRYPYLKKGEKALTKIERINIRSLHDTMEAVYHFFVGVDEGLHEASRHLQESAW